MQFGEVVYPSSRALWGAEDEEESDTGPETQLSWLNHSPPPDVVGTFLLFEGKIAKDFADTCLVTQPPAATLSGLNLSLYHLSEGLVVCTCEKSVEELGSQIAELLEAWITKAKRIIAIQSQPHTAFLGDYSEDPYILRSLHTSKAKKDGRLDPILEQPNVLSGLTAGVLSYCQFLDLSASAWCLYSSLPPFGTDSTSIQPIHNLLEDLQVPLSKSFKCNPTLSSNLYM